MCSVKPNVHEVFCPVEQRKNGCLFWYNISYKKMEKSDYVWLQATMGAYELEYGWQKGATGDCELQLLTVDQNTSDYKWLCVTITFDCHTWRANVILNICILH